jgi:hypothetical protein
MTQQTHSDLKQRAISSSPTRDLLCYSRSTLLQTKRDKARKDS